MNIQHYEVTLTARETNGQSHSVMRIVTEEEVRTGTDGYLNLVYETVREELHEYLSRRVLPGLLPK